MAKKVLAINLIVDEEFVNMGAAMVGKIFTSEEEFNKTFFEREERVDIDLSDLGEDNEAAMAMGLAFGIAILAHDEQKNPTPKKKSGFMARLEEAQKLEKKARNKKQ